MWLPQVRDTLGGTYSSAELGRAPAPVRITVDPVQMRLQPRRALHGHALLPAARLATSADQPGRSRRAAAYGPPAMRCAPRYWTWPRISPPGKSPGPVLTGGTPSLVCTLTYVFPLCIAAITAARSVHPHALPGSGAVAVPSASVPWKEPPPGAPRNKVRPTGPLTPGGPQWMCAATALSRLATLILNTNAAPSSRTFKVATPTACVSRAGTSLSPDSGATKLSPATAGGANARSASASPAEITIVLRILLPP